MGKLYDDVVAKLPIVVMYGDESEWDEEEKERCLGDDEAFGFDLDEELAKVSRGDSVSLTVTASSYKNMRSWLQNV